MKLKQTVSDYLIDRRIGKEVVVHKCNGILSAIKRNKCASVVVSWMNLELIKQSKVRKRKTNITY